MKKLLACGAAAAALIGASAAHAAYPSVGNDTLGPQYIISITGGGASIIHGPGFAQGAFDGIEDTYIGVENTSGRTVGFLDLTGSGIFGFDNDGLCRYNSGACSPVDPFNANGNAFGDGYAGGNTHGFVDTYFSNIVNSNQGRVNFSGGLGSGQSAFFSLEEALSGANVQITQVGGVPEPATWAMMLLGFFGLGATLRRRREVLA
jgi:hypothetical protein